VPKFTRIPKAIVFKRAGAPAYLVPVYAALADYADNRSGRAWPKMTSLASTLNLSVRTVQRHLAALQAAGLVEFVERRRSPRGRFSSWCYRLVLMAGFNKPVTTGHGRRPVKGGPIKNERKQSRTPPLSPSENKEEQRRRRRAGGYGWLFGDDEGADGGR